MSQARDRSDTPRAIIHKLILDLAESRPEASMAELAEEVTGASTDMVEKVLAKYGDPGETTASPPSVDPPIGDEDGADRPVESDTESMAQTESDPDDPSVSTADPDAGVGHDGDGDADGDAQTTELQAQQSDVDAPASAADTEDPPDAVGSETEIDLTDNQRKTLQLIAERPDASQAELSEDLDVSGATVSRWVNEIPEFDWDHREEIANTLLNGTMDAASTSPDRADLEPLRERIDAIERQLDATTSPDVPLSPELAHKVMHACLHSDRITEDEELELLAAFMGHDETA